MSFLKIRAINETKLLGFYGWCCWASEKAMFFWIKHPVDNPSAINPWKHFTLNLVLLIRCSYTKLRSALVSSAPCGDYLWKHLGPGVLAHTFKSHHSGEVSAPVSLKAAWAIRWVPDQISWGYIWNTWCLKNILNCPGCVHDSSAAGSLTYASDSNSTPCKEFWPAGSRLTAVSAGLDRFMSVGTNACYYKL